MAMSNGMDAEASSSSARLPLLSRQTAVAVAANVFSLLPRRKLRALGQLGSEWSDARVPKSLTFWASHAIVLLWPTSITDAVGTAAAVCAATSALSAITCIAVVLGATLYSVISALLLTVLGTTAVVGSVAGFVVLCCASVLSFVAGSAAAAFASGTAALVVADFVTKAACKRSSVACRLAKAIPFYAYTPDAETQAAQNGSTIQMQPLSNGAAHSDGNSSERISTDSAGSLHSHSASVVVAGEPAPEFEQPPPVAEVKKRVSKKISDLKRTFGSTGASDKPQNGVRRGFWRSRRSAEQPAANGTASGSTTQAAAGRNAATEQPGGSGSTTQPAPGSGAAVAGGNAPARVRTGRKSVAAPDAAAAAAADAAPELDAEATSSTMNPLYESRNASNAVTPRVEDLSTPDAVAMGRVRGADSDSDATLDAFDSPTSSQASLLAKTSSPEGTTRESLPRQNSSRRGKAAQRTQARKSAAALPPRSRSGARQSAPPRDVPRSPVATAAEAAAIAADERSRVSRQVSGVQPKRIRGAGKASRAGDGSPSLAPSLASEASEAGAKSVVDMMDEMFTGAAA